MAAERAVRDQLTTTALLIGTEATKMSALELRAFLWPVLGANARPSTRPLTLDASARAGTGVLGAMSDDRGAPRPGYFRLARGAGGEWTADVRGALATESAYARTVLEAARRWTGAVGVDRPDVRIGILYPS